MLLGLVCQLRYDGGGLLLYRSTSGDALHIPFPKAGVTSLRIGQRVTFSLSQSAGHTEAVGIKSWTPEAHFSRFVSPEAPLQQSRSMVSPFERSMLPREDASTRRFQRNIGTFHNANLEERLRLIDQAEAVLKALLTSSDLDGDAICSLVNRLAAWLHPPFGNQGVNGTAERKGEETSNGTAGSDACEGQQSRIRKLLICSLRCLDLEDFPTYQQVQAALGYMLQLLQKVHLDPSVQNPSRAVKQWAQLQSLLPARAQKPIRQPPSEGRTRPKKRLLQAVQGGTGAVDSGVYHPQKRVQALPSVFPSEDQVRLQCPGCDKIIRSSWFWRHPRTAKVHVLVPHNGHAACTKRIGKRCLWKSLDPWTPKTDHVSHLAFCQHKRREGICKDCGGREMCVHQRQRANCRVCKKLPRERPVKRAKECQIHPNTAWQQLVLGW